MLIEIWSDIACPFCYLGLTKLHKAIANLKLQEDVRMDQIKVANTIKAHLLLHESHELGLRGVPYFIFDRKVAIHGAREVEAFERALGVI